MRSSAQSSRAAAYTELKTTTSPPPVTSSSRRKTIGEAFRTEIEDRPLSREAVSLLLATPGEGLVERVEHALARGSGRVECTAFHQRLERTLVYHLQVDAFGEVPKRREGASLFPLSNDR